MSNIYRFAGALLCVVIRSCTASSAQPSSVPSPLSSNVDVEAQNPSDGCSVTMPRRVENVRGGVTFDPSYVIGSDKLWTEVSSDNIVLAQPWLVQADGSIRVKWPWLYQEQVEGDLKVVGQLMSEPGGAAPEVNLAQDINPAEFPDRETGLAGSVSYMVFPSTGCWNVRVSKGSEQFQFTTPVVEVDP